MSATRSSSYSAGLLFGGDCGRLSDGYLEYLRLMGDPKDGSSSSRTRYFRFASDETVHLKGFSLTFIAYSDTSKLCCEMAGVGSAARHVNK